MAELLGNFGRAWVYGRTTLVVHRTNWCSHCRSELGIWRYYVGTWVGWMVRWMVSAVCVCEPKDVFVPLVVGAWEFVHWHFANKLLLLEDKDDCTVDTIVVISDGKHLALGLMTVSCSARASMAESGKPPNFRPSPCSIVVIRGADLSMMKD